MCSDYNGSFMLFSFQKFTPVTDLSRMDVDTFEVGEYFLTSEASKNNKVFYYVVKIIEIINEDTCKCYWYEFKGKEKLFVKLNASWNVGSCNCLSKLDEPVVIDGAKRKHKTLFSKVFKFFNGRILLKCLYAM